VVSKVRDSRYPGRRRQRLGQSAQRETLAIAGFALKANKSTASISAG
jgi:hypothetical protein